VRWYTAAVEEVAISEFKAKCLALLERVRKTQQPIRVTRFGKPVADVVPPSPVAEPGDWLGTMAETIEIVGDIVSPVMEESDWEAARE
jgi:prevent-host-death family protein